MNPGPRSTTGSDPDRWLLFIWSSLLCLNGFEVDDCSALVVVGVLLPLWVVLGHNALYITVGFVWLLFVDDSATRKGDTICQGKRRYGYQLAGMLCLLIFADSLLGRIEGNEEMF